MPLAQNDPDVYYCRAEIFQRHLQLLGLGAILRLFDFLEDFVDILAQLEVIDKAIA